MPDYRLDFQDGYMLRSDPDPFCFSAASDEAAFARAAKALDLDMAIGMPNGIPNWAAYRRKGAKALVCNGVAISEPVDTRYYVDSDIGDRMHHTMLGGCFVAMSNRKVVVSLIADFLNALPNDVTAEEVLDAFSMGPSRERSKILRSWEEPA